MSDPDPSIFAANLNRAIDASGLSQVRLARVAGVDLSNLNALANGHAFPNITTLVRLARALDTTASELLRGVE